MLLEFRDALTAEINSISAQITAHEEQLRAEDDRAESGRLRLKIVVCRRHRDKLEQIKKHLSLPIDVEIEDILSRFDRWFEAAAEAEEAEAAMFRLEPLAVRSRNAVIAPENAVQAAEYALSEFLHKPADRLASGAERSKAREREDELRKKVDVARKKMLRAAQERDNRQNELVAAMQRRDAAIFKARMLLSPEIVAIQEFHETQNVA